MIIAYLPSKVFWEGEGGEFLPATAHKHLRQMQIRGQ